MMGNKLTPFNPQIKVNTILGTQNSRQQMHVDKNDASNVVMKIRTLLDKLPEVEKAKGTITIKLRNKTPKTLSFNYG